MDILPGGMKTILNTFPGERKTLETMRILSDVDRATHSVTAL